MKILLLAFALSSAHAAPAPAPGVPREARRHFVKAVAMQKEAKDASEFLLAAGEYREALKAAPKWGAAQYNLGVALEAAGDFAGAKAAYEDYLKLKPKDAQAVEDKLDALEGKAAIAAKRAATAAAPKEPDFSGAWYGKEGAAAKIEIYKTSGGYNANIPDGSARGDRVNCPLTGFTVSGRTAKWHSRCTTYSRTMQPYVDTDNEYTLSEDGRSLSGNFHYVTSWGATGDGSDVLFKRD